MKEIELCHWLLFIESGKCRSVFAPSGDFCDGFRRVGPAASSPQFALPIVFAMKEPCSAQTGARVTLTLRLFRDDKNQPGPAFCGMPELKVATLVSELSSSVASWVQEVGASFVSIEVQEDECRSLVITFNPQGPEEYKKARSVELVRAGISMMAFARGLSIEFGNLSILQNA